MKPVPLLQGRGAALRVDVSRELRDCSSSEATPQEVWWALEDLWLRLRSLGLLRVERTPATTLLVIQGLREAGARVCELRSIALDAETYQSWHDGRRWNFVRTLEYRGGDLVCELMPPELIARWPDGGALAWQVRGFLARLEALERGEGQGSRA